MNEIDLSKINVGDEVKVKHSIFGESDWIKVTGDACWPLKRYVGDWVVVHSGGDPTSVTVTAHKPSVAALKAQEELLAQQYREACKKAQEAAEAADRLSSELNEVRKQIKSLNEGEAIVGREIWVRDTKATIVAYDARDDRYVVDSDALGIGTWFWQRGDFTLIDE